MGLNANEAAGGGMKIEPMEGGTYPGYVVQIVDLGLQARPDFQGEKKDPVQQLHITYEMADEFLKDEDGQEQKDKPRWVSEYFPLYNLKSEKAKSTHRYKALDPTEVHGGDWSKLLGTPCFVTIVQNPKKGRVYENVAAVASMREKDAARFDGPVHEPKAFDLDNPDMEVFLSLPKWVQELVKNNLNYEGSALQKLVKSGGEPEKEATGRAATDEDDEEENPY